MPRRGKLPDRSDFAAYGDDAASRMRDWRIALAESARLADDLPMPLAAIPLHVEPLP